MCTVTFVPTADGFYLTSNRDEHKSRGIAQPPQVYSNGTEALVYPRDPDAGGSWIVMKENGTAAVLLNGAFLKHPGGRRYRISRGMVLLGIIRGGDPLAQFREIDLGDVEPFTLVLLSDGMLRDCRWDGFQKYVDTLDPAKPHIWSSVTLYDEAVAKERRQWFEEWRRDIKSPGAADVVRFHQSAGKGDTRNDLVMNREDKMSTVSVTSIVRAKRGSRMIYHDLKSGNDAVVSFDSPTLGANEESTVERFYWFSKRFLTRLTHWEYWPAHVVYGPLYLFWLWLSIRSRSLFFFSAANPGIEYAGFTHERKSSIYRQMPTDFFPRTLLCPVGTDWDKLTRELDQMQLFFPLIAKPDIGERGRQVRLVRSAAELRAYWLSSRVDFLVQEFVDLEMEAGIFYTRIPGEDRGQITGIVGKQLLTVTGDGRSTIRTLLRRNSRYHLQLRSLSARFGNYLDTVLPEGVRETLAPYGNHSLGAKFVDWSDKITDDLTRAIDTVCRQIPDFCFGRLDIKFSSWDDLLQGKNFSIIELNGAGSEPTHIYDPGHSLLFAWKEIIRHWRLLRRISLANSEKRNIPLMRLAEGLKMLRLHARHLKLTREL